MKRIAVISTAVVTLAGINAMAWDWFPLSVAERSEHAGATHVAIFKNSDFTQSATNTAETFTNTIPAKHAVELVSMNLVQAFDTGNTNYSGRLGLKIGDGSDDDLFLASTELASDASEVYIKYGPPNSAAVSATFTRSTATAVTGVTVQKGNFVVLTTGGATQTISVVTNVVPATSTFVTNGTVSATATAGELGRKLYPTGGNVVFTFTPNATEALDDNVTGEVRVYFRVFDYLK